MKITKRKLKKIIRESLILEINPEFARLTATDASAGKSIAAVRKMDPDEFMKGVEKMGEITGMVVYEIFANFPGLSNYISSAETAKEIWEISRIKKEKEQKERKQARAPRSAAEPAGLFRGRFRTAAAEPSRETQWRPPGRGF